MASSFANSQPLIILSYSSWYLSIDAQPNCQQGRDLSNPGAKWVTESQSVFFPCCWDFLGSWPLSAPITQTQLQAWVLFGFSCLLSPLSALLITAVEGLWLPGHRAPMLPPRCSHSHCSGGKWRHLGLVELADEVIHQVSRRKANHMNKMCHLG